MDLQAELDIIRKVWNDTNFSKLRKEVRNEKEYEEQKTEKIKEFCKKRWDKERFYDICKNLDSEEFSDEKKSKKFRELLNPFPDDGEKRIYCKYDEEYDHDNCVFSVLTNEMIEVDNEFFNGEERYGLLDLIYKPYFYNINFFSDEKTRSVLKDQKIERNKWYEIIIKKCNTEEQADCCLSFGASPLTLEKILIKNWFPKIVDNLPKTDVQKVRDDVENYYNKQNDHERDHILKKLFEDNKNIELFIWRVGQANAIGGRIVKKGTNAECKFAFDLGLPNNSCLIDNKGNSLSPAESGVFDDGELVKFQPNVLFVSHWHEDHYKGVYTMPASFFIDKENKKSATRWIAPYYNGSDYVNINRLILFLMKNELIYFVRDEDKKKIRDDYTYKVFDYDNIALFRVKKDFPRTLNNDCILLQLNKTLLPGDCSSAFWPNEYGKYPNCPISNVIVPHHGADDCFGKNRSNYDGLLARAKKKLKSIFNCTCLATRYAYVCVGNNTYHHPNDEYLKYWENLGFQNLVKTKNATGKIIINDK